MEKIHSEKWMYECDCVSVYHGPILFNVPRKFHSLVWIYNCCQHYIDTQVEHKIIHDFEIAENIMFVWSISYALTLHLSFPIHLVHLQSLFLLRTKSFDPYRQICHKFITTLMYVIKFRSMPSLEVFDRVTNSNDDQCKINPKITKIQRNKTKTQ